MALLPVPSDETAQRVPNSRDQVIPFQLLSAALARVVQVRPSGDVITLLPVPDWETAQNSLRSLTHVTPYHWFVFAVRVVHVIPSGDVITKFVPDHPTAQNSDS